MFDEGNEPEDIFADVDTDVAAPVQTPEAPQIVATSFGPSRTPIILGVIAVLAIAGGAGWYFMMGPGSTPGTGQIVVEDDISDLDDGIVVDDDADIEEDDTPVISAPVSCGTDFDCVITAVSSGGQAFGRVTPPSMDLFGMMVTTTSNLDVGKQVSGGTQFISETVAQSVALSADMRAAVLSGGGTEADIAAQEAEANEAAKAVIGIRVECVFTDRQDVVDILEAMQRGDADTDMLSAGSCDTTIPEPEPEPPPTPIIPIDAPDAVLNALDSDRDGLNDFREQELGTNPQAADTDSDGLSDLEEVETYGSDPTNPDTDGDTYLDGDEVKGGYNPNGPGTL